MQTVYYDIAYTIVKPKVNSEKPNLRIKIRQQQQKTLSESIKKLLKLLVRH